MRMVSLPITVFREVGCEVLLDDLGKEKLRQLLWQQSAFCGVEFITYFLMSNYFYVLENYTY